MEIGKHNPENNFCCDLVEDESALDGEVLYKEGDIPGKGVGAIACTDLPAGTLVIREVPALYVTPDLDGHAETIKAFSEMDPEDQNNLLQLFNFYSKPEREWSESMRKELEQCVADAGNEIDATDVSRETALRVWQIWLTNAYDNGVFLHMSRLACIYVDVDDFRTDINDDWIPLQVQPLLQTEH